MKGKLMEGMFLIDDVEITYKVIKVFTNSAIVLPLRNINNDIGCEIMTFQAMENEGWQILKVV